MKKLLKVLTLIFLYSTSINAEVNFQQKKNFITKTSSKIGLKYFQTATGMLQVQGFSNI